MLEKSIRSDQPLQMEMLKHCKKLKQTYSSGWVQKAAGSVEINNKNKTRTHTIKKQTTQQDIRYKKNKIEKKGSHLCPFAVYFQGVYQLHFFLGRSSCKMFYPRKPLSLLMLYVGTISLLKLMFYVHGEMFPGSKPGHIQT